MEKLMILQTKYNGRVCIGTKSERAIIDVWKNDVIEGEHDANELARRIVASYNACEGLTIEDLESGSVKDLVGEVMRQNAVFEAQNTKLLELLVWLKTEMEKSSDGGKIWCAIRTKPGAVGWIQKLDTAIESTKTETP